MNPLRAKEAEALLIRFAGRPVIALRVFRPGFLVWLTISR